MANTSMKKRIRNYELGIRNWVNKNRIEAFFLISIFLIGAFFRLYRIGEYMTFLGDEGRDVIIVRRLLVNFDPILIGPRTSIGDMYLGPLYYYLMAPALLLSNLSPVGPSVMIALFGIATIFLVWYIAREWFSSKGEPGKLAAFMAAFLYATAPVVITYSRSSWNPNIMPFFALLSIYAIWKVLHDNQFKWLVVIGISMAFVLQSHYLGLLLLPTIGFFWALTLYKIRDTKYKIQRFSKFSLIFLFIFLFLMSPLVIFDARHGWRNFASMKKFFTERQTTVSARPWTAFPKVLLIWEQINTRLITGFNEGYARFISYFTAIFVISYLAGNLAKLKELLLKTKNKNFQAFIVIFVWLGFTLIGLGVYKQHVYDHYFGFFFPAPFLLLGGIVQEFYKKNRFIGCILLVAIMLPLVFANLTNNPLKYPPNRQLQRTKQVAEKIAQEADDAGLNLAVIAERNYEDAYQYFLEKWKSGVVEIDPQRADVTVTNQLFVVCELAETEKCDPTHSPKAEIANFGWSKIEGEWQISGVTLYKLVHSQ
jgi:4-amino-4-deoxy-L-arabinose transferase-like glycosyltransferase